MARVQGRRRGFIRGHGPVSFAHVGKDINSNNNNTTTAHKNFKDSSSGISRGKSKNRGTKGSPNKQKNTDKSIDSNANAQGGGLENELDNILHASTLAKHIDPPFTELEDDFSRLKTQSIQLATLVLHLQSRLESDQPKPKKVHPPEAIAIGRSLPPDFSSAENIKTTTFKAPLVKTAQPTASDPLSIIYSSAPQPWSSRRPVTRTHKAPKTPGTAAWAGSPMSIDMASPLNTQLTPTLDRLLDELHEAIQKRDGERVALDLQIEPPLAQAYTDLSRELQKHYPWGKDQHLRTLCEKVLPKGPDGVRKAWESFAGHLLQYLQFIRDYAPHNLLKNNNDIKRLLNTSCICLGDATYGVIILPTVLYLSKVLAKLALGLDRRPELVAQLMKEHDTVDGEGIRESVTFVEDAANTIREAFIKCLSDKSGSGGFGRNAAPEGKRIGIYKTGNLCLKLLFQCRKLSSATTMFVSIDAQSPLLSHYPAPQRVTYLYYLGRYLFANNHFFRAQLVLQAAYDQCHAQALGHRELILVYLIASNICLGRFPSSKLLLRREAARLAKHFLPLCRIIALGDLSGFEGHLSLDSPHGRWYLQKRLLLQLRNRCEILVWRSLARRVFIEVGFPGGDDNKTPFLRLHLLQAAAQWLNARRLKLPATKPVTGVQSWSSPFQDNAHTQLYIEQEKCAPEAVDSEFAGMEDMAVNAGYDLESGTYIGPSENQREQLASNGASTKHLQRQLHPTIDEVESIMASLIQQDLIVGFLTHNNPRYAIPGAKTRGALAVGFPPIWPVIKARKQGDQVPGWVKKDDTSNVFSGGASGGGGGRVVNLSGARPVGAGAA